MASPFQIQNKIVYSEVPIYRSIDDFKWHLRVSLVWLQSYTNLSKKDSWPVDNTGKVFGWWGDFSCWKHMWTRLVANNVRTSRSARRSAQWQHECENINTTPRERPPRAIGQCGIHWKPMIIAREGNGRGETQNSWGDYHRQGKGKNMNQDIGLEVSPLWLNLLST